MDTSFNLINNSGFHPQSTDKYIVIDINNDLEDEDDGIYNITNIYLL